MNTEQKLDKATEDALAGMEKTETQVRQTYTDPATEARKLMAARQAAQATAPRQYAEPPRTERVASTTFSPSPRMVPRQAPEMKLTPVEHLEQALENLEKATAMLMGFGEYLTGTSPAVDPVDHGTSEPSGIFNRLHQLTNRVDRLADEIQREVSRVRDWV